MGESNPEEPEKTDTTRRIDVDKIELVNILALYHDHNTGLRVNVQLNQLESQFSFLPGQIDVGIQLNIDINQIKYQEINIENKEDVMLSSQISYDLENRRVQIEPSFLSIAGLDLETWGSYDLQGGPGINMAFRASNSGLEVLNFLFLGVLDLDEVQQIGSGSIHLDGSVTGSMGETLPIVRVNGIARDLGFRIKSIDRAVEDISFTLYATNGGKDDFSEALMELKAFTASFPEGNIRGDISSKKSCDA